MKRAALLASLALVVSAPALAQPRPGESPRSRMAYANPSAAIAADIAFSRLAQTKGRWIAFRETSTPEAVMFVPQMVLAQPWLKDRANPAKPLTWQPHAAWASCDGSLIVTSGAWQSGEATGWYTTIWQRQEKGGYKWVFDHGGDTAKPLEAPDMLEARVAECPPRKAPAAGEAPPPKAGKPGKQAKRAKPPPVPFDPTKRSGSSRDGSLVWDVTVAPDGAHRFTAKMRTAGEMREFRDEKVPAGS